MKHILLREERPGPSEGRMDPRFPQKELASFGTNNKNQFLEWYHLRLQAIKNAFAYFVFCNKVFNFVIHVLSLHRVLCNLSPVLVVTSLFYGNIALRPRPSPCACVGDVCGRSLGQAGLGRERRGSGVPKAQGAAWGAGSSCALRLPCPHRGGRVSERRGELRRWERPVQGTALRGPRKERPSRPRRS